MHAVALVYFREVVRTGSVRKAANFLDVAPSALNRQILKLEAEFGARLFDRLPSGMRLTAAGELLLRHVTATLNDFDRVRAEIDDLKGIRSGHVSIVAIDSLLVDFLPRAVDRFRADFPAVRYSLVAVTPTDVPQEIIEARADLGFTFVSRVPPEVRFMVEIPAPIGVVMPAEHPLAACDAIPFEQARAFPFLAQTGPIPRTADIDPDFAAFRAGLEPKLVSNSIQTIKLALTLNMGIAFFTRLGFLHEIAMGQVAWRPFRSPAINRLKVGLLVPTSRSLSAPALQLARRLTTELKRYAEVDRAP